MDEIISDMSTSNVTSGTEFG